MKRTTILLAEDHAIVREGLRSLLELWPEFEVVGEASTGRLAVEMTLALRPSIVVMDVAMPLLNGFEATRQILLVAPETKILVLSAYSDEEYVMRMVATGASGYLLKQNSGETLLRAIREITAGKSYYSASILKRMQSLDEQARASGSTRSDRSVKLTTREAEILQLVAEGAANKQMAATLRISIKTVEKHRQHLMDKLDIHETAGLTRYAISTGVIESSSHSTKG